MSKVMWNGPANIMGHHVLAALYCDTREWVCVVDDGMNKFDSEIFRIVRVMYVDGREEVRVLDHRSALVPAIMRAQEEM